MFVFNLILLSFGKNWRTAVVFTAMELCFEEIVKVNELLTYELTSLASAKEG